MRLKQSGVKAVTRVEPKIIYQTGERKDVVVAAPHHGYMPRCDYYTKEVASMLAEYLGATLFVAENIRPQVDLNKDPRLAPTPEARSLCCRYQQLALAEPVKLFIEIHGHVNGHYDVEISCGFVPDPDVAFDRELRSRLFVLQSAVNRELEREWQNNFILPRPSIGVFPLDDDVVMKATKTYLFQRIRDEQLNNRRIFGLHIEVFRDYKCGEVDTPTFYCQKALVKALAAGINKSFLEWPI